MSRLVPLVLTFGLLAAAPAQAALPIDGPVTVTKVVDGDTIDVVDAVGSETRVRLLYVDTPEVGDCLADAAERYTARHAGPGNAVVLRFDVDPTDPYGRTLAVVETPNGMSLSVGLALNGLAAPMQVDPNRRWYPEVVSAWKQARSQRVGMFNPRKKCSPAARLAQSKKTIGQARSMPVRTAGQYALVVAALDRAAKQLSRMRAGEFGMATPAFQNWLRTSIRSTRRTLKTARAFKARQRKSVLASLSPNKGTSAPNTGTSGTSGGSNSTNSWPAGVPSTYTGPRCYAPGGQTWRPC